MSDKESFPSEVDVPAISRTSSISWYAKPWNKLKKLFQCPPDDRWTEKKNIDAKKNRNQPDFDRIHKKALQLQQFDQQE